ncbi:tripartite tricarboxylate transporter TctB family protein [Telmatospirillum sp. J64-1]|uniref:tripartite tricarboxylate transporter TctB family protein n=1 Tax=Telmatospirillum sp. J64-1 TaxID=2502183 RepID=UPI00163DD49C|nr:tripartite tricarboxylate transporter TctB family protein [Telmatospirillum sp. J64-1]
MFFRLVVSSGALFLCVVFLVDSFSLRTMSGSDPGGPAMFPRILIALTGLCALIELFQILRSGNMAEIRAGASALFSFRPEGGPNAVQRVALTIVLSVLYPLVLLKVGFILATTLFVGALAMMLRVAPLKALGMGVVMSLGIFFLFAQGLDVRIPPGQWFDLQDLFLP